MGEKKPYLSQVAFSVVDIRRSVAFYRDVFGLDDAGGTRAFRGPDAEKVQGVKGIASTTHWLIDDRSNFQLEFFEFESPPKRPFPDDWRPCDVGLTRLAFHVRDLDATLELGRRHGASQVGEAATIEGRRYASLRDPDGVLVEVEEAPGELPAGRPSRFAGVALSVPDLAVSLRSLEATVGTAGRRDAVLAKDSLWGLNGAEREATLIDAGTGWIEVSRYRAPVPAQRPSESKLIDIGLSHVAFGVQSFERYFEVFRQMVASGLKPNSPEPMTMGKRAAVMYMQDPLGFTWELLYSHPKLYGAIGFARPTRFQRAVQHLTSWLALRRYGTAKAA